MDHKQTVAEKLFAVLPQLDIETIYSLLEKPKSSEMGDVAFPAFSLAKVERKRHRLSQRISWKRLIQLALRKLLQLVLMSTSSWIRMLFPTKS